MDFHGKVALITSGGNGIGFATRGAKVVVVDGDEAATGLVRQQGGDALFVAADLTRSGDVRKYVRLALDRYGAIDCFCNNAGIEGSVDLASNTTGAHYVVDGGRTATGGAVTNNVVR